MLSGISCSYKTCLQFVRQKLHYNIKIINIRFVFTLLTFKLIVNTLYPADSQFLGLYCKVCVVQY